MISFRLGASLTLLVVGLSVASLVALYDGTLLPNDTAQYLSVARHLEKGEGLATDLVFFPEHHVQKTMPAKETGFAPGFPLLVAGAAALGLPLEYAAFLVTAMSLGLAAILIFLLVNRSARSPGIAWCALMVRLCRT